MKKIIAVFIFFFAFAMNGNAQEQKSARDLAKEDAKAMCDYLEITGDVVNDYISLFEMKHETLLTEGISQERKDVLADVIEKKLFASISPSDIEKLQMEPELLKRLKGN